MSSVLRILSFVPPMLLFVLPTFGQLQGKIEQIPGGTYQVSLICTQDWTANPPSAEQGQITIRAAQGELQIANFQAVSGSWEMDIPIYAPIEAADYDYFSFGLQFPTNSFNWSLNDETVLFTFENVGSTCTYIEIIENQADPFFPPNSQNANIGNSLNTNNTQIFDFYEGNSTFSFVDCVPLDAMVSIGINPVLCYGDLTDVSVDVIGGREPYQVYWQRVPSGGFGTVQVSDYQGNATFNSLGAGDYEITVTDDRDSAVMYEITIEQPSALIVDLLADDATCDGSMDGQVTAFANGGTVAGDYQFYWNTNPGVAMSHVIGMLDPGNYGVTVIDDNGCQANANDDVDTYNILLLNPQFNDISCFGANDGVIDLYPVSPNGPFTFEWSSNVTTGEFSSAWMLGAGTYDVTVTDNTGVCTETGSFMLTEPEEIIMDYGMSEPQCYGDPGYVEILGVENAVGDWNAEIIGDASEVLPGTFEVEAGMPMRLSVTDANGCEVSENFLIPAKQEMYVDLGPDQEIKYGETVNLDADVFPNTNVNLDWTNVELLSCEKCPNPETSPTESTVFRLRLTDDNGCTAEDQISIAVRKSRDVYIPNAFSPNQDGINDIFCPMGGFEVAYIQSMLVFDRWGGLIYENKDGFSIHDAEKDGWDGSVQGKRLDNGTYLYSMNVEFIDGEVVLYSGEVNLLR